MMRRIKTGSISAIIIGILLLMTITVFGADTGNESGVYDNASLFSKEEEKALQQKIEELKKKTGMDIAIATTQDAEGKSTRNFADDFYIQESLGVGKEYDGILYLIDMDNREVYINSVGGMIPYITDKRRQKMLDQVYKGVSSGDYAGSAETFLTETEKYYNKGIPANQYNYDENTGNLGIRWYEALFAAAVAAAAGILGCVSVVNQYSMKKEKAASSNFLKAYRADCGFQYRTTTDNFLDKRVIQTIIPRSSTSGGGGSSSGRSTTHSSGGRTFSGGGRKF